MKTVFCFICIFIIQIALLQLNIGCVSGEKSCKEIQGDIMKKQMRGLSFCAKKLNYKGKEKSKKMNCLIRCVMIKEGFLDKDGHSTPALFESYIQSAFPPSLQDRFNGTLWGCMEMAFVGLKSPEEDENCSSYDPFLKCMVGKVSEICA